MNSNIYRMKHVVSDKVCTRLLKLHQGIKHCSEIGWYHCLGLMEICFGYLSSFSCCWRETKSISTSHMQIQKLHLNCAVPTYKTDYGKKYYHKETKVNSIGGILFLYSSGPMFRAVVFNLWSQNMWLETPLSILPPPQTLSPHPSPVATYSPPVMPSQHCLL